MFNTAKITLGEKTVQMKSTLSKNLRTMYLVGLHHREHITIPLNEKGSNHRTSKSEFVQQQATGKDIPLNSSGTTQHLRQRVGCPVIWLIMAIKHVVLYGRLFLKVHLLVDQCSSIISIYISRHRNSKLISKARTVYLYTQSFNSLTC